MGRSRSAASVVAIQHQTTQAAQIQRSVACASSRPSVFLFGFGGQSSYDDEEETFTVMRIQFGIFGDIDKWQKDLEKIAEAHDTDEEDGLHDLLLDTLQLINRKSEYVGYCATGGKIYNDPDAAEAKFKEVSFEERSKFKDETFSNVEGRVRKNPKSNYDLAGLKDLDQWMCVTMIMALERKLKLPVIDTVYDVKKATKVLAGISVDELLAFELLWTPEDPGDSYSKDELLTDYPTMVTLS
eukprot:CAMPEP_0119109064 /NCGR_PEP_ID=MMETSP1180-20130426/17068_1 /TAXON_ID=3052 ORGANISM="Chlamydomonas cf sp, Strain CCMP681" /NCGR_SAMPLE_ID=MMETSP1180 /ASSEMBLY_ACC=CAM_ASM_000741 /LENGTH=240 /DNA_ID=CAMNT_0007094773 /DNA_START=91 /DNA_END=813 /DNA_ORIENTATION=-